VQDRARRLRKEVRAEEFERLEQMRQLLSNQLAIIDSLWHCIEGAVTCLVPLPDANDPWAFDDLDEDLQTSDITLDSMQRHNTGQDAAGFTPAGKGAVWDGVLPEFRVLPIPSAMDQPLDYHREIEIQLRQRQADTLLTSLRELIADKSFHYSHVLRLTTRHSMRSRARNKIAGLNAELSLCCCTYNRCRTAMIRLQVPEDIMKRYQPLTKSDIKASTALLDPNRPGSSTLRLSWIWQTWTPGQDSTTDTMIECTY
jgi:hypothetical protein